MINRVMAATSATFIMIGISQPASANSGQTVGVAGTTSWPEIRDVVASIGVAGVPIQEGCADSTYCIVVKHERSNQAYAAITTGSASPPGNAQIIINDTHDGNRNYRTHLLYHELGHALGLWEHSNDCGSVMYPVVAGCGFYVLGYSSTEKDQLRKIWR